MTLHKYCFASNSPINNIDPSGNLTVIEIGETMAIWPQVIQSYWQNSLGAKWAGCDALFFSFGGWSTPGYPTGDEGNSIGMYKLSRYVNPLIFNVHQYYSYQSTIGAANVIKSVESSRKALGKGPVKVVLAGHSAGGTAAVYLAHQFANDPNVELSGLYLVDAIGPSDSSNPGKWNIPAMAYLQALGMPLWNPEDVPPQVKHVGVFYQRVDIRLWGINTVNHSCDFITPVNALHTQIDYDQTVLDKIKTSAEEDVKGD